MGRNAVTVENVTMRFNLATEKYSGLKEYVIKLMKHQLLFEEFFALRNISFEIKKGDAFAIVGANGSGKSTLFKIISGIFAPTEGHISVDGTIVPLIELGAGFDFELTARENIFLNGAVLGYDEKFMRENMMKLLTFLSWKNLWMYR
jgi:ABC-2 type transport system ATP-binding protein/lipopolysaccharide transport system ATP-binding protein